MKSTLIGHFAIMIENGNFTRNTNIVNKMCPYIQIKQTKDKSKEERKLYRGKSVIAKTSVWIKGHKTPVWKWRTKLPDYLDYKPIYVFKVLNKASLIGDEQIGRWVVDLTEIREIGEVRKVNYAIKHDGKVWGTICLSFKYKSYLKDVNPAASHTTKESSNQEEVKTTNLDPVPTMVSIVDGDQEYDDYIPWEHDDEADDNQNEAKSSDEEFMTVAERNRAYHRRFLYFVPKSNKIFEFDHTSKKYNEISKQTEILHPQDVQATELPDGSYLLSGGRDAESNEMTKAVVHFFNGEYFGRSDILTPRVEHCTAYLKGFVYCFGGYNDTGVLSSVQAHDMNNDVWIDWGELKVARYRASVWKFDDHLIYLFGGWINFDVDPFWPSIERFDVVNATSEIISVELPKPMCGCACVQKDDSSIIVLGGYKFSAKNTAYELKLNELKWKQLASLSHPCWSVHPLYVKDNKITIFSSENSPEDPPKVYKVKYKFN